jgi:hypothetical protein
MISEQDKAKIIEIGIQYHIREILCLVQALIRTEKQTILTLPLPV